MENEEQVQLTKGEKRRLKRQRQKEERDKEIKKQKAKKMINLLLWIGGIVIVVGGLVYWVATKKSLPPTSQIGHIEASPPSHILSQPMRLAVFKHMLEHADGSGPPGVIINYDCESYDCEEDFIDRLEAIAREYPTFVYLAPFNNLAAKVVMTAELRQETFDEIDEEALRNFIRR